MKISLRDITLAQLNNKTLTLIAKYVRLLKLKEGQQLKFQEPDILIKISESVRSTEHPELIELYENIKEEIRIGFSSINEKSDK